MFEESINFDSNPETRDDESLEALPDVTGEPALALRKHRIRILRTLSACAPPSLMWT